MSEISMYEAQKKKLQGLCDEHDLVYRFIKDRYPITLTIKPVQGVEAQMSMLEDVEEVGYRSPDASMTWIFEDGVLETKVTGGTFTISKTLRGKIENVLVKMIAYWPAVLLPGCEGEERPAPRRNARHRRGRGRRQRGPARAGGAPSPWRNTRTTARSPETRSSTRMPRTSRRLPVSSGVRTRLPRPSCNDA